MSQASTGGKREAKPNSGQSTSQGREARPDSGQSTNQNREPKPDRSQSTNQNRAPKPDRSQSANGGRASKPSKEQPAKVSYFFGKGYSDLLGTIKEAWTRNLDSVATQFGEAREEGIISFMGAVHLIATISILIFGTIITAATTVVHVVVLFLFFAVIYICFALLFLIDRIYIMIHKIRNACPNPNCQASFLIPVYECPRCGAKHTNLVPSKYGILKRRCLCGEKLPTCFLNGRGSLTSYCPDCGQSLSGNTGSRQYAIPVIGGPSVGKSCFMNMAIGQLMAQVAPDRGWQLEFLSEQDARNHSNAMRSLSKGIRLMKTESNNLTACQMMLTLPGEKIGRRIYLYDISGEMFSTSSDIQSNQAYSYADGFLFLIDPLTLYPFLMELGDDVNPEDYGASTKDFEDILNIMLINLEKMFGLKDKDTLKLNLAVIINKSDVPTLEERIGLTGARQYFLDHGSVPGSFPDARSAVCREFLLDYGAGNFVRAAEAKFRTVRYFSCSSLGHNDDGTPFRASHVTDPILWLLSQVDPHIPERVSSSPASSRHSV